MLQIRRSLFRSQALEHYIQSREKSILPRITRPPVSLGLWMLLVLCVATIVVACLGQVPVYISGSGVVLEPDTVQKARQDHEATALVFLSTSSTHSLHVRVGAPVRLQIGTSAQTLNSIIFQVEPDTLSPREAQTRFGIAGNASHIVPGPSIAILVKLGAAFPVQSYTGSIVNAQVQIGTTRVLSLLLGTPMAEGE